jgi:hypothetical protein
VDEHLAFFGELDPVPHEVDEDLPEAAGVADHLGRHVVFDPVGEFEVFAGGRASQKFDDVLDGGAQFEGGFFQLEFAGLDLREIENVVDDGEKGLAGVAHGLGVFVLLRV